MRSAGRSLCAVSALFLALPCSYSAEPPAASAPPSAAAAAQDTAAKPPVIHVQSNLVLVDVVVTKNGAPVKGLTKDKFRVLENGMEQELKSFEEHTGAEEAAVPSNAAAAQAPELPPNTYSDFAPRSSSSAVNVLLLDALNTQSTDQGYVRRQMLEYLKKIPPGTRMAVFTLSSRLRMVQGFTQDASLLAKVISDKGTIEESIAVDKSSDAAMVDLTQALIVAQLKQSGDNSEPIMLDTAIEMQQFAADLKSFNTDEREEMTQDALRQIARYLAAIPGRKNLIWFSGSFPLAITPVAPDSRIKLKDTITGDNVLDPRNPNPMRTTRDYATDVRVTDRLVADARIAVYTVDAHGLLPPESSFDASTDVRSVLGLSTAMSQTVQMRQVINAQNQAADESHLGDSTLQEIAADTGGKAFVNSNGFQDAIKQALADSANYYTIGYRPEGADDGKFRHIKIKLDGGYALDYRSGYYADSATDAANSSGGAMQEAVQFGAPPLSEIPFKVRVISSTDPAAQGFTPAAGPAGADAKGLKPPVTRYLIDYIVDAHHFTYTKTSDGMAHTRMEFTVLAYDADGKVINATDRGFDLDLTPEAYARMMSGGFPQHQEIDLPAGQVFLRIVVHDQGSARVGATEVPLVVAKK